MACGSNRPLFQIQGDKETVKGQQVTRMRVLRHAAEPIPTDLLGKKSKVQRMPSGEATPRHLSLQKNPATKRPGDQPNKKAGGGQ